MSSIHVERIYDDADAAGKRILVDRLWPRGVSKERARIDLWLKEIAPSTELRKAFHGDTLDWPTFRTRYIEEIKTNQASFDELLSEAETGPIVLLYGSRDTEHNHALILRELLRARIDESGDCADCLW